MYFKQILNERCGCASYVIASRKTREARPSSTRRSMNRTLHCVAERAWVPAAAYVIDTHIHADHVSGASRRLAAAHGSALCLHESARSGIPIFTHSVTDTSWSSGHSASASCTPQGIVRS